MAQYRATIQGNRGEASRLGHKTSGLNADVNGWNVGVSVDLWWDEQIQEDRIRAKLTSGSHRGDSIILFEGSKNEALSFIQALK